MKLTQHFSLEELVFSETAVRYGVDNTPNKEQVAKLVWLAGCLEQIRILLGPLHVNSGYRCLELNRLLKSKDTSQHVKCEAVDLTSLTGKTPMQMCQLVRDSDLAFDQLIFEFKSWMHVSFAYNSTPRGSILTIDGAGVRLGLHNGEQ